MFDTENKIKYIIIIVVFISLIFGIRFMYNKKKEDELSTKTTQKVDTPTPKVDTPTPKVVTPTLKANIPTPKAELPKPKVELPTPKAELPTPKAELPKPKAELPTPKLSQKNSQDLTSDEEVKKLEERSLKQRQDILNNEICGNDYVPKCKKDFEEIDVSNNIKQTTKCCILKDTRNEVDLLSDAKTSFDDYLKTLPNIDVTMLIAQTTKNNYDDYSNDNLINKITLNLKEKMQKISHTSLEKLVANNFETKLKKIFSDILKKNKTILNTIFNLPKKMEDYNLKQLKNIRSPLSDWLGLTIESYYKNLNKNLKETTYNKEIKNIRDNSNKVLDEELKNAKYNIPIIVNPISKISNINILLEQVITEYSLSYVNIILELILKKLLTISSTELSNLVNLLYEDAINYLNSEKGINYLDNKLCSVANGKYIDKNCIYEDKKACDNSYDWQKILNDKNSTEIYTEFRDSKCVLANPTMRKICEDNKINYNYDTQLCDVNEEYCKLNKFEFINKNNEKDCKIPIDNNFGYNIFGEKIINQINETYDSTKYKQCKSNEIDSVNINKDFSNVLDASVSYMVPFNIPSLIHKANNKKTCIEEKKCLPGKKLRNGVCFEDCKDGYIEENNSCFKKYAGFDVERFGDISGPPPVNQESPPVNQERPPVNQESPPVNQESPPVNQEISQEEVSKLKLLPKKIEKKIDSNKPIGLNYCSPEQTKENLLCYDKCRDEFKSDGAVMCYKQYSDFEKNGQGHTITSITKKIITNTGKPLSFCPPDKSKENLLCYDKCKDGFSSDGAVLCYKNPPSNWPGTTSLTHLQHKTHYTGPGKPLTVCNPDEEKGGALCYPKCKDGFSSDGVTQCYKNPPDNWPGTKSLTHLQHKTHYTGPGKPLTECNSNQEKGGALCYPKCRDGFYSDKATLCYRNNPPNWPGSTSITHLQHKTQYSPAKPITECNSNQDKNGALCYPKCNNNYNGVGPVCWEQCRPGEIDTGAFCMEACRPGYSNIGGMCQIQSHNRGAGTAVELEDCPSGWHNDGLTCREPLRTVDNGYYNWSWGAWGCHSGKSGCGWSGCSRCYKTWIVRLSTTGGRIVGRLNNGGKCSGDRYKTEGMCYRHCPWDKPVGKAFLCYTHDVNSIGLSYAPKSRAKHSYGRGAGEPLKCAAGLEQRGALCYENCSKFNSNGIVYERRGDNLEFCSTKCPSGFTNIGIGGCQRESYNRGAGEPLKCATGLEQRGALCYENCNKFNSNGVEYERRNDNIDMCSTKCPPGSTNIGIGGCQKEAYNRGAGKPLKCAAGLEQRGALCYENCNKFNSNGVEFERRGDNIDMCSTKCPPGSTNIGIGGCQKEAYNRGIGKPMQCLPHQKEIAALCYEPCPNGSSMQSLGLCSQNCPPGSKDFGVGCTREAYNRGVGKSMGCAPNQTKKGALCYKNCPKGSSLKEDGKCTTDCPPGTIDTGTSCEREFYNKDPGELPYSINMKERIEPYIFKKINPESK